MLNVQCGDLVRLDTGEVVMVEWTSETRIHGRCPEAAETTMTPNMGPRLGWRPIEKTRVTHVMRVTAGSVVWEDVSAPTVAPSPPPRTKAGDRIRVRGNDYVVVDVETPGPALRAAFPDLAELVVVRGKRGGTHLLRLDGRGDAGFVS